MKSNTLNQKRPPELLESILIPLEVSVINVKFNLYAIKAVQNKIRKKSGIDLNDISITA